MYEEHYCCEPPENENSKIWRYLDFTKFVSLLDKQAIFFVKSACLSDFYEGVYPDANLIQEKLIIDAVKSNPGLKSEVISQYEQNLKKLYNFAKSMKDETFINSWHESEFESAAMWKLYLKSNEGIAIQSTFKKLKDSFPHYKPEVYIGKVKYIDYDTQPIVVDNLFRPFMHKRKSYEHEREIRAITSEYYVENEQMYKIEVVNNGTYVPVLLDTLIEKIFVSPTAPIWFEELVKSIMKKYNLEKEVMTSVLSKRPLY